MALFLTDSPYDLTPRGQKLIYRVISTNITQDGFKYGVKVTDTFTSQEFNFFYTPDFSDGALYFDLSPLVNLRNFEGVNDLHSDALGAGATLYSEPEGDGFRTYTVNFTEWWLVGNVLTKNTGVGFTETTRVFNGYYQPSNGYKPDVNTGIPDVSFSCDSVVSYAWSDRKESTYKWPLAETYTPGLTGSVYIPAFSNDYGMLMCCPKNNLLTANDAYGFKMAFYTGDDPTPIELTDVLSATSQMEGVRIYPGNLQYNTVGFPQPSAFPNWTHYVFYFRNSSGSQCSRPYVFFNAEKFGLGDCKFNNVRLAWVGSRGGWDYQNFTKKSEESYTVERRQFRQILTNNLFNSAVRQLTDRQNIVDKVITINSDWLQEGEFEFLKSLLVSNQVHIVNADGTQTPVSVAESNYIARRERMGKKYNLTLKIAYSQDYWS